MRAFFLILYYTFAFAVLILILLSMANIVALLAKFIGKFISIILIVIFLFILFSIPKLYFIIKKKPSVEPGVYRLEEIKDKE